jgi:hypothetical protein
VSVALYAVPAVAAARDNIVTAGRGLTLICRVADFVVSVTDVAVTVAVKGLVTEAGVLYVAVDVLCAVNVPPPLTVHCTPAPLLSWARVAVIATV